MAVLNDWQKITRVISGKPFGDGSGGDATISSDPNTRATITASASGNTATLGSAILSNGDVFMAHQTQGSGAGTWEINKVVSGGGTTSVVCMKNFVNTFGTGAQAIKIPMYSTATISSYIPTPWNGSVGGIDVICGSVAITGSGTITLTGKGFDGGNGASPDGATAYQGESTTGAGGQATTQNGMGGGGSKKMAGDYCSGGGGGGHAAAGTIGVDGTGGNGASLQGAAGGSGGSADLVTLVFGGAGGGCAAGSGSGAAGGNSGGIMILVGKAVTLSDATINILGAAGATGGASSGGAGGGAGGAGLIMCQTATLGTNKFVATQGAAGAAGGANHGAGGAGSVGRIAVHHSGTVTGTTTPTFTDVSDPTLKEITSGMFMVL